MYYFLIDGHHKLIRWGFVTHGCIDGYSRVITYLKCSTDNRASTVYKSFLEAVRKYGLPSRLRSDHGRENIMVAQHILEHRGMGRGSVITGRSTHNQRIERLWHDVHKCATQLYYRLFYHLEDRELLDPLNDIHLFALQYVYLPRINKTLKGFMEGWNNHRIRTAGHNTPNQLFVEGVLRLQIDFSEHVEDTDDTTEGDRNEFDSEEGVVIPQTNFILQEDHYEELTNTVDPEAHSDTYGTDLYQASITFIHNKITSNQLIYGELVV